MSGKVLMQKVKYNGFDPKLSEPSAYDRLHKVLSVKLGGVMCQNLDSK